MEQVKRILDFVFPNEAVQKIKDIFNAPERAVDFVVNKAKKSFSNYGETLKEQERLNAVYTKHLLTGEPMSPEDKEKLEQSYFDIAPMGAMWGGSKALGFSKATNVFSDLGEKVPMFEIPDDAATLTKEIYKVLKGESSTAGKVMKHDLLFKENYPQLMDVPITPMSSKGTAASFHGLRSGIKLNKDLPIEEIKGAILHELSHGTSAIEGRSMGTSVASKETIKNLTDDLYEYEMSLENLLIAARKKREKVYIKLPGSGGWETIKRYSGTEDTFPGWVKNLKSKINNTKKTLEDAEGSGERYKSTLDEIRARDVESRSQLTAKEREGMQPYSTQNIPVRDWIINPRGETAEAPMRAVTEIPTEKLSAIKKEALDMARTSALWDSMQLKDKLNTWKYIADILKEKR